MGAIYDSGMYDADDLYKAYAEGYNDVHIRCL
jgi:hypothetical protein